MFCAAPLTAMSASRPRNIASGTRDCPIDTGAWAAARVAIVLLLTLLRSQRTNRNRANQREAGVNNCFLDSALNELC
jgi:hypothetical protein